MTVVTVSADSSAQIASSDRFGMHAFTVGQEWTIADTAALHCCLVTMTTATGFGNAGPVDSRLRIARWQDCAPVAILRMTIKTRGRFRPIVNRLSMETVIVSGVRRRVEERTCQVRERLSWGMASLTFKRGPRPRKARIGDADTTSFVRP